MEEPRKRQRMEEAAAVVALEEKCEQNAAGNGDLGEDIVAWLSMDEETVSELMSCLDGDAGSEGAWRARVKFVENPYSSPLIFQSSSAHVTINGNEESCGSSFSDWDSSVMASVDVSGFASAVGKFAGVSVGAWVEGAESDFGWARGKEAEEEEEIDVGDWVERVLGDDDVVVGLFDRET